MSLLPRAFQACIDDAKINRYLLDEAHPGNGGKAAFFLAMGFAKADPLTLKAALRQHPIANEVVEEVAGIHGTKYRVDCSLQTPNGRNPCITTIWIIEADDPPRFVTAYPRI